MPVPIASVRRFTSSLLTRAPRELLADLVTMVHVVAVLTLVEGLVRWIPLPRLSRLLGLRIDLGPVRRDVEPLALHELPPRLQVKMRWARRVADLWPLSRGPCLRRAPVTGHLPREHQPSLRLGVLGDGDEIVAHAWLEMGDRPLESVSGFQAFQVPPSEVTP